MKFRHLLAALTALAMTAPAAGQLAAVNRMTALSSAKNFTIKTNDGSIYYYLVSANDYQIMHLKEGALSIGTDEFAISDIQSMQMRSLPHFILDEDSTTYNKTLVIDHGLLALRRSLVLNHWNSLVVPVNLTTEQVIDAFGEGTQIAAPRGFREGSNTAVELQTIEMEPGATVMQANYHYLINPTREPDLAEGRTSVSFISGIRLAGPVYLIPNVNLSAKASARIQSFQPDDNTTKVRFRGTYIKLDDSVVEGSYIRNKRIEAGTYMLNEDGLIQQNEDVTEVKAFCSWIDEIGDETHDLKFYLDGVAMNTTGIADLQASGPESTTEDDGIYDMGGRRIGTAPISGANLRPGIYIVHGRKVVVK